MATPPRKPAPASAPAAAAAAAASAAAAAAAAPAPKKKARGKIAVLTGAVLAVAGAGAGGWFYMHNQNAEAKVAAPEKKKAPVFLPLDPFTVNLTTVTTDHFLQIGITLEVTGTDIGEQLKQVLPVVRSRILLLLASKTADELAKTAGKQKLMEEILAEARAPMPAGANATPTRGVENVHFSSFVIQ